ncbi:hypothetical protein [Massilia sp. Mn16-1_5]|uniref:hypothetical protein n=1 Tax=Massilia sp. Mn16-1_5 TaxID=2079199 RepID=UPI00109ECCE6|nr:hypothetical protein [Massilia sp. Mn16-1_5]THC46188.1 hypothetical protein C2862_02895 [Massilia sp. Mn16-1_5]
MTNALDKTNAAAQAQGRLARLARRGVALAVLACAGIGAAHAQYHGRRDDAQLQPPPSVRAERFPAPAQQIEQPREQRGYDQMREQMREQQRAYEEQRRQAAQMQQSDPNRDGGRRGGRLTPDERRDLRRQINEAGMDIYPNAQRR